MKEEKQVQWFTVFARDKSTEELFATRLERKHGVDALTFTLRQIKDRVEDSHPIDFVVLSGWHEDREIWEVIS